MAKADNKTKPTQQSVTDFLNQVEHKQKRTDSFAILEMMKAQTGLEPKMWGDSIIGFGDYRYKYASGREGDWFLVGFSPRKQNLTLYIMAGINQYPELLKKLGKHKTSKACLYINKLADVDTSVLEDIIKKSAQYTAKHQSGC
ncbi:DUF1801 domain-containing protein [Kangiella geojedonensis]|mgnify:FL=1|uniref:YdhG-like domain-containing protein n=1 Tax=Kangiella geojedonensis TaxID=914150 RepID=A0A0F6RCM1_9GAMM|nr:DUF1801 domain-containing protein [Kangiella geojedonensis]AKE52161.1 hypothetical protein TQ33_1201 [Kangiella geojedonensis]